MDPTQRREIDVVCEAGKAVLLRGVQDLVEDANGMPMLTSKSCDGTPMSLVHRSKRTLPSGTAVRTQGRQGAEWFVKNQFVRARTPAGDWVTRVLLSEPVSLSYGKSVPAVLGACFKDWKRLRSMGHWGCSIEHYVFDRAGFSAMDRMIRQWHEEIPFENVPTHFSVDVARLTEFTLITPCALHDSQNAFKWGFFAECSDTQMMRDIYVAIESLRNSADLLSRHMAEWVRQKMRLVPARDEGWVQQRRTLLHALSVSMETVDVLASELQLEFQDGELLVSHAADVPGGLGRLRVCCVVIGLEVRKVYDLQVAHCRHKCSNNCGGVRVRHLQLGPLHHPRHP